uniref:PB1-like domain-containing protein n=1 Tax=Chenopodium quinoa TaxID=63459 RepID=A0A803LIX4_CHEQI
MGSLRYWHGGSFKIVGNGELVYMGGKGRTFQVSPDELCYWELLELGTKCGDYINIDALYYLVPGKSLADGLRKIAGDAEVLEMGEIVMKHRSIDVVDLVTGESEYSDEEVEQAKQRVQICNNKILEIASQLQREVCEGRFGGPKTVQGSQQRAAETTSAAETSGDAETSALADTPGAGGGAVRGTKGGSGRGRVEVGVLFSADGPLNKEQSKESRATHIHTVKPNLYSASTTSMTPWVQIL